MKHGGWRSGGSVLCGDLEFITFVLRMVSENCPVVSRGGGGVGGDSILPAFAVRPFMTGPGLQYCGKHPENRQRQRFGRFWACTA